ncbi:hypothetical protein [Vibrio sp. SCSIO 43136]|uniref:hypothetical protein n=1 Tax=Vibrio sp. SCSIO 43136 TaxID=2819101 RepID=UPI002074DD37|nr:hypothetical protein [Vibrio sp. SCSIO 43136]USD68156.1 hypothetical protein J4N39_18455 [Vibrio sp. SCSIO 43136]
MRVGIVALSVATLAGCGGGGGSDGGSSSNGISVYSSQTNFSVTSNVMTGTDVRIPIDSRGKTDRTVYISTVADSQHPVTADMIFTTETGGYISVYFPPGYQMAEGQSTTKVYFAACYDQACNEHLSGSPIVADVNLNVILEERIAKNSAAANLSFSHPQNTHNVDDNIKNIGVTYQGTDPSLLTLKRSTGKAYLNHVYLSQSSGDQYQLNYDLMLPANFEVGNYNSNVSIDVCYDEWCNFPIKGSPISVPLSYQVTTPTAETDNAIALNQTKIYQHNVLDVEYVKGLDVLLMTSSTPTDALYIYDISEDQTHSIALPNYAQDLSVDQLAKLGRVAISHNSQVSVIDLNPTNYAASTLTSYPSSLYSAQVAVRRDDLFAFSDSYAQDLVERTNLATYAQELKDSLDYMGLADVKFSSLGGSLISIHNNSPASLSVTDLENGNWKDYPQSEYLPHLNNKKTFWLDNKYLYISNGEYYPVDAIPWSLTNQLPIPSFTDQNGFVVKPDLLSLYQSGDNVHIALGYPTYEIRTLTQDSHIQLNSIPDPVVRENGSDWNAGVEYIFESQAGHLFALMGRYTQTSNEPAGFALVRIK